MLEHLTYIAVDMCRQHARPTSSRPEIQVKLELFFLWSQNGIRTIPSEVSAAFKTIKSHLRLFLFLVFRLVFKGNIKKTNKKPQKTAKI